MSEILPSKDMNTSKCSSCFTYLRKSAKRRKIISSKDEVKKIHIMTERTDAKEGDFLCDNCRIRMYLIKLDEEAISEESEAMVCEELPENVSQKTVSSSEASTSTSQTDSSTVDPTFCAQSRTGTIKNSETIEMIISRVISTHKYCFICGTSKKSDLVLVPFEARLQTYIKIQLFIPSGNRCCRDHLLKKRFYDDEFNKMNIFSTKSVINVIELQEFFNGLSVSVDKTLLDRLSEYNISEQQLLVFTGLRWENILELRAQLTSMRSSSSRTITQALIIFLFKLRTGESNKTIASIFEIEYDQKVSDMKNSVLKAFEKDILSKSFGLNNVARQDIINQTSCMAKKIHNIEGDKLMLICDGTYIRHEKSMNNEYQRKSFSGQKKVPLCKPFTICTTNGYIVDMLGPFLANKNDAEILRTIYHNSDCLKNLLQEGDMFILDRGFRDVKQELETNGFIVLMPAFKGKRPQLSTEESNYSRFVTKLRWVVEAVHGILKKKYQLLDRKLDNKMLPQTASYCRIACHLNNLFGKRLDSDIEMNDEIVNTMNIRRSLENTLAAEVETRRWSRRKLPFKELTSSELLDFPEMTEKDLKIFFTGSYQLKQTISYLAEMLDENNKLNLAYCQETPNIIKIQVQSRHINRNTYKCFIEYRPNGIGHSAILRYCCNCANGNRTVGCCAHNAAVIYYLSHGRYLSKLIRPAEVLSNMFLIDESVPSINEDSDDDE